LKYGEKRLAVDIKNKKNVYLFQPQFSVEVRNEINYWLPYSVGCLWSYAQQFDFVRENFDLKELFFKREDPKNILSRLENPVVCGFSCYVWNREYCLHLAELIKKEYPNCHIEFGGPQTSSSMLKYDFIDSIMLAEGEQNFVLLLENILDSNTPPQIFPKNRLDNLEIPSPYITGVFDKIIKENPTALWAMVLETNRGCPFQCTFCDWGSNIYSKVRKFNLIKVEQELLWAEKNKVAYIFLADANFGIFKDRDIEIAKFLRKTADRGDLESVNVQYAKNSTEVVFEIAKTLGNLTRGITVSVQSMNDETLETIKRKNLDINNIRKMMQLSQEHQIGTYTEVILGLPHETLETWKDGLGEILEMGQHDSIDIWFCQLLENSELNSFESKIKHGIKTITALDYMPFGNSNDYNEISEKISLISSTNTMSIEDMAESYMFGWTIIHFHIGGYSQQYAKYSRNILGVSYRNFYEKMQELILDSEVFYDHYQDLKSTVIRYLKTGNLSDDSIRHLILDSNRQRGHGLGSESFKYVYDNRFRVYMLSKKCVEHFGIAPDILDELQKSFIYDQNENYPKEMNLPWDFITWKEKESKYLIDKKNSIDKDFNFYLVRRRGLLKNSFNKIS
jgi:putative methyltransferase